MFIIHVLRRSEAEKLSEAQKLRSSRFSRSFGDSGSEHACSER
jgi:hypothetical protein